MDERVAKRRIFLNEQLLEIIIFALFVVCLAAVGRQAYRWYELKAETNAIKGRIEVLRQEQQRLAEEQAKLHTHEYVEKIAREEYNMVGKDEMPVFIVEEEKSKKIT